MSIHNTYEKLHERKAYEYAVLTEYPNGERHYLMVSGPQRALECIREQHRMCNTPEMPPLPMTIVRRPLGTWERVEPITRSALRRVLRRRGRS